MTYTPPTIGAEGWGPTLNTALEDIHDTAEAAQTTADGKAAAVHSHAQSDVTGLSTALSGKANTSHTHVEGDVTGLTAALAGKAATSHTHAQSDVTNLTTDLAGKAATSHAHAGADITSGTVAFARLPTGTSSSQVSVGDHTHDSRYYTETETDALLDGALTPSGITLASGDDLDVGSMLSYTPAIQNGGSAVATTVGRYMYVNVHMIYVQAQWTLTTAGTGAGLVGLSLPVAPDRTTPATFGITFGDSATTNETFLGYAVSTIGGSGAWIDKLVRQHQTTTESRGKGFVGTDLVLGLVIRLSGMYFV